MEQERSIREELLRIWKPELSPCKHAVLLGLPSHGNAGDILIWEGTRTALKALGVDLLYEAPAGLGNWDRIEMLAKRGATVLILGGGSLGDIWPHEEVFRRRIIQSLPYARIIQLPQTARYTEERWAQQSRRVFDKHPDLTFMLRDGRSLEHFQKLFPRQRSIFSPDAALALGGRPRVRPAEVDVLVMARGDSERGLLDPRKVAEPFEHRVEDWTTLENLPLQWRVSRRLDRRWGDSLARRRAYPNWLQQSSLGHFRRSTLRAISRQLSAARLVVTDRLHVHIACALLDIPHVVVDNSYGKIRAIFDSYTFRLRGAYLVDAVDEGQTLVAGLLAAGVGGNDAR